MTKGQYFWFSIVVFMFGGAVVALGANELHGKVVVEKQQYKTNANAKDLIRELRGEGISPLPPKRGEEPRGPVQAENSQDSNNGASAGIFSRLFSGGQKEQTDTAKARMRLESPPPTEVEVEDGKSYRDNLDREDRSKLGQLIDKLM